MQMQGFMFVVLLVAIPLMLLFANHTVFFIVVGLVLSVVSINDIKAALSSKEKDPEEIDEDFAEELEDTLNIDLKKFGTGISVMKSCLAIVFFIYCAFYISLLAAKIVITLLILYKIRLIIKKIQKDRALTRFKNISARLGFIVSSICTLLIVLVTACNKFIRVIM